MPQDGRKSARYIPFVTCDDPKGVVEGGTIRKSKLSGYQTMAPRTDNQTRFKDPNKTLPSITDEKDYVDDFRGRASLQLSEVSKGVEKLNHMIESWSKNLTVEGHPKDLAKDLLKGALDLQDSLMMLGKLQTASTYVAKLKKKQEKGNNNGGQEGRFFWKHEETSKEQIEELKEIIKGSFEKQNLLRVGNNGGKRHFSQFDREPDIPSTSSSNSSSSYNLKMDQKLEKSIAKGPGIIAKLMGLEEISSKPTQKKPLFNTDMQMPKLNDRICEDSKREEQQKKKTLKEVLDTMHLKGLLKGSSVKSHCVSRDTDTMPPIVLIKPLQTAPPESDAKLKVRNVDFWESTNERRSTKFIDNVEKVKPSNPKPLQREVSNKKPGENDKAKNSDRNALEKGTTQNRVKEVVKPESRENIVVTKKGNDSSKKGRNGVKKEELQKQRKELRTHRTQTKIRKKDQKMVNESKEAKSAKGNAVPQKEDEIKMVTSSETDTDINQQSIEVIKDVFESRLSEEHTLVKGYDSDAWRSLLLSSQSFVTRAEDLFSFISSSPTKPENPDSQSPNKRLYIDCATELIERKSLDALETQCIVLPCPLRISSICISMDNLVSEVCDGIEILSSYWSIESDTSPADGLYAVLKHDLNPNRGMVGSKLWDLGWNKGFSSDDVEKVVIQLEEIIWSCLIEEVSQGQT